MSLEQSVELMVNRLQLNRGFPKYQFERSLDAFLSLFLAEYFSNILHDTFVYVAAEFPLRKENSATSSKESFQSTNVDYLLLRKGPPTQWYFVELKTDIGSQKDAQLRRLNNASGLPFSAYYSQVAAIKRKSRQKPKYNNLIKVIEAQLKEFDPEAPIVSVCLTTYTPSPQLLTVFQNIKWVQLSDFDQTLTNTAHPELWKLVRPLFVVSNQDAR